MSQFVDRQSLLAEISSAITSSGCRLMDQRRDDFIASTDAAKIYFITSCMPPLQFF
ncbi:hypothetical protein SynBIOSE41_01701 [Synechococcus sp. BIOS-E4-1]|nr:hypothetical protein SynBIOSE41_01701 [Synechococcus sp. BIOS-E4-1]